MKKFIMLILFAFVGCADNTPKYGKIVDVYKEFRLGSSDHTTIIELDDGTRLKYCGKLGQKGEIINTKHLTPTVQ